MIAAARALLLLILANSAPWAVGRLLRGRWAWPLDGGRALRDGKPLLGSHKTWRGLISGAVVCGLVAPLTGLSWQTGAALGALALLGDAFSSAIKRRLALLPGTDVPGLDQLPEALLPLAALAPALQLGVGGVVVVALLFTVLGVLMIRLRR